MKINLALTNASDITVLFILIILLISLIVGIIWLIVLFNKKRKKRKNQVEQNISIQKNDDPNNKLQKELLESIKKYKEKLINISNLDENKIKQELIDIIDKDLLKYKKETISKTEEFLNLNKLKLAQELIIESMHSIASESSSDFTTHTFENIDDSIKARLIGKKGRNLKKFELVTGCDVIIEKTPQIIISCLNPIRREKGINTLKHLIKSNAFDEMAIENIYNIETKIFENNLIIIGNDVIDNLSIKNLNPKIYPYIGKLKFRSSYGQNALEHSIECAKLAEFIAKQLELDFEIAKLCGLFHDIGKSIDYECQNDHIKEGAEIARECNLPNIVLNSILDHHSLENNSIYSTLTKIVDTISASRPGARFNSFESTVKRVLEIEAICKKHKEVLDAYAIKAGRYLKVMLQPSIYKPNDINLLAQEIRKDLEANEITNKFEINISFFQTNNINITTTKKI